MWTSKTVYTSIVTGVVAVCKGIGEATGAFHIPPETVEVLLATIAVFMRMGIKKAEK